MSQCGSLQIRPFSLRATYCSVGWGPTSEGVSLPFFRLRRKPAALDGMQSAHAPSGAARYARLTQPGAAGRLRLLGPEGKSSALAFAAGALLTILCDTMLPEAFDELRDWTGALVVTGFAGSLAISALWDQNAS